MPFYSKRGQLLAHKQLCAFCAAGLVTPRRGGNCGLCLLELNPCNQSLFRGHIMGQSV